MKQLLVVDCSKVLDSWEHSKCIAGNVDRKLFAPVPEGDWGWLSKTWDVITVAFWDFPGWCNSIHWSIPYIYFFFMFIGFIFFISMFLPDNRTPEQKVISELRQNDWNATLRHWQSERKADRQIELLNQQNQTLRELLKNNERR